MQQIDTRGLSCPQPVILVNNQLKNKSAQFDILLDSVASKENVARLLKRHKRNFKIEETDEYTIYHVR